MKDNIDKVAVASCGGKQEAEFAARLSNIKPKKTTPRFVSRDYINTGNAVLVLQLALNGYKDERIPLILLISKHFLDTIWSTTSKSKIVKTILSYSTKHCVHIWFDDLKESEVEKYSTGLCRKDSAFRRLMYSELPKSDDTLVDMLMSLITDTSEKISFQNHSVQDEIATKSPPPILDSTSMNYAFTNDVDKKITKESFSLPPNIASQPSSSGNAKKKRTRGARKTTGHYAAVNMDLAIFKETPKVLLFKISYSDRNRLTSMLDVGYGANWKQIAGSYEITNTEISNIELSVKRDQGPSEVLFQLLQTRKPDLELKDLQDKCKKISRNDVADEIEKIIAKQLSR